MEEAEVTTDSKSRALAFDYSAPPEVLFRPNRVGMMPRPGCKFTWAGDAVKGLRCSQQVAGLKQPAVQHTHRTAWLAAAVSKLSPPS